MRERYKTFPMRRLTHERKNTINAIRHAMQYITKDVLPNWLINEEEEANSLIEYDYSTQSNPYNYLICLVNSLGEEVSLETKLYLLQRSYLYLDDQTDLHNVLLDDMVFLPEQNWIEIPLHPNIIPRREAAQETMYSCIMKGQIYIYIELLSNDHETEYYFHRAVPPATIATSNDVLQQLYNIQLELISNTLENQGYNVSAFQIDIYLVGIAEEVLSNHFDTMC